MVEVVDGESVEDGEDGTGATTPTLDEVRAVVGV